MGAGRNKTPLLGWHPPAEISAWVRAEAARRDVPIATVLNDAVAAYMVLRQAEFLSHGL